jgi:cell division protein FtsL
VTRFHTVKPIDNSRLVRPAAPNHLREMARLVALGGLVAAVALLYAWQHFACIQLRYQLEALKSQRAQAAELNQELKLEVAGLRAPSRIDGIARRQLGLTVPVPGQIAPFEAPSEAVFAEMRAMSPTRAQ